MGTYKGPLPADPETAGVQVPLLDGGQAAIPGGAVSSDSNGESYIPSNPFYKHSYRYNLTNLTTFFIIFF